MEPLRSAGRLLPSGASWPPAPGDEGRRPHAPRRTMERRFDWGSPSSRLVLSAALDTLSEIGYEGLTLEEVRVRAGAAGSLVEESDLTEIVATALEQVRVFDVPAPTGDLRADLATLLRPWLTR